jgi:hypothetical protein
MVQMWFAETGCGSTRKSKIMVEYDWLGSRNERNYTRFFTLMRPYFILFFALIFCLAACGPKPAYKTHKGKKKQKYYNSLQYGGRTTSDMKRP